MVDRFPDYDVLAKRRSPSWNDPTRAAIAERIALTDDGDLLEPGQRSTLRAITERIVPQPHGRAPVNTAAILLSKITNGDGDGYRPAGLPRALAAWRHALDAIDAEARARHGSAFADLDGARADALLTRIELGDVATDAWGDLSPRQFWQWRLLPDIVAAYYSHPSAWSAMGFGGPASPRGYVRLDADRRDPWEAAELGDGRLLPARLRNRHAR